jgi:hypothetical protein
MSNMQRFMGILYCVDVDGECGAHGPDPKTLYRLSDIYKKINPEATITLKAVVRPSEIQRIAGIDTPFAV